MSGNRSHPDEPLCPETGMGIHYARTRYDCRCDVCAEGWEAPKRDPDTNPNFDVDPAAHFASE